VTFGRHKLGQPSNNEVRGALERVVISPTFRSSPQLAAFLKFIVESALAGHPEDIKGYTIAIKALGRSEDFNPKTDAIVRVEAGRLRRALATYYSEAGVNDPIGIEIPARGYVPTFHRRTIVEPPRAQLDMPARMRALATRVALAGRPYAAAIALLTLGAAAYWGFETWYLGSRFMAKSTYVTAGVLDPPSSATRWRGRPVGPIIQLIPTKATGTPTPPTITAMSLHDRLRDTFARFEDVTIVSDAPEPSSGTEPPPPTATPDYRFYSEIEYNPDATITLAFHVVDTSDGATVWSRGYDHLAINNDPRQVKYPIVREVAATLFNPFGVIKARDRNKIVSARVPDPRYRCVLESGDYWRSFDVAMQPAVRDCLEQVVAQDPTFAGGYALLARVYLRDYQFAGDQPADPAVLDRALDMVKRAIELRPNSARAYYVLLDVQMTRGAVDDAIAAGETAIKLNPDDPVVTVHYAMQLIGLGEVDKGRALLEQLPDIGTVPQTHLEFALFLASYLKGDLADATAHANRMSANTYSLGHLAHALVAHKRGEKTVARQAYERLVELAPAWRANARAELKKLFASPKVVDRIAEDLNDASGVEVN
jgi:Flp pilus assembly protein TadD